MEMMEIILETEIIFNLKKSIKKQEDLKDNNIKDGEVNARVLKYDLTSLI